MPGRPAIPTHVHAVKGTASKRLLRKRAGVPAVTTPLSDPPAWLPPGAKAEWDRVLAISGYSKAITEADRGGLITYCLLWDEIRTAVERDGNSTEVPASRLTVFASLAGKFGMTPSDRVKVRVPEEAKPTNKFSRL